MTCACGKVPCTCTIPTPGGAHAPLLPAGSIQFASGGIAAIRIDPDGAMYINGRRLEDDRELVRALRAWVQSARPEVWFDWGRYVGDQQKSSN